MIEIIYDNNTQGGAKNIKEVWCDKNALTRFSFLKNDGDSVIYTNKLCNNTSKSLKFGEIIREDISCFSEKFGEVDCGDVKYTMGVFKNNRVIMYGDKIKPHECIDFKLNVKYDLSNVYSENYGEITVKLGSLLFDVE